MRALLIDIGNSRIKSRIADRAPTRWPGASVATAAGVAQVVPVADVARLPLAWAAAGPVDAVSISNVASPRVGETVEALVDAAWPGVRVDQVASEAARCGVVNGYREPATLGTDRWMAAIGAHRLFPDRSVLICSFGTATTIDLVVTESPSGEARSTFVGGLILPGLTAMRAVLTASTARLPLADGVVRDFADRTVDAIASGVLAAQSGAVALAVRDARSRLAALPRPAPLLCVMTGGATASIVTDPAALAVETVVVQDLVLDGLQAVAFDPAAAVRERSRLAAT